MRGSRTGSLCGWGRIVSLEFQILCARKHTYHPTRPCSWSSAHDRAAFRSDPPATRMRGVAQGGARVPRRGDRCWYLQSLSAAARGCRCARVLAAGRRARLDRHDLAEKIWRPRAHVPGALCRDRGDARRQRAGPALLRRRPPKRAGPAALRPRPYQGGHPAAHLPRRAVLRDRHERAELRLRPVRRQDARNQDRRRLADQRLEDLDDLGATWPTT
ncbi:hypothetical protein ACVILH_001086 [Bradyrhizobium sp. USDA 4353]